MATEKKLYSTWVESRWFTYWRYLKTKGVKEQQFVLHNLITFTFEQINKNINKCINIVLALDKANTKSPEPVNKDEIKNLKKFMKTFMDDVINQFKGKGIEYEVCTIRKSNSSQKSKTNRSKNTSRNSYSS